MKLLKTISKLLFHGKKKMIQFNMQAMLSGIWQELLQQRKVRTILGSLHGILLGKKQAILLVITMVGTVEVTYQERAHGMLQGTRQNMRQDTWHWRAQRTSLTISIRLSMS